jgi:hypothetical protein
LTATTTVVSYTNTFGRERLGGKRWLSACDRSSTGDDALDMPFRDNASACELERPSAGVPPRSNIKVLFTNKLSESFRNSFVETHDNEEEQQPAAEEQIAEKFSDYADDQEEDILSARLAYVENQKMKKYPPDSAAETLRNNMDFMIRLNFFAQRLTETIAEEASNDIVNIIQLKQNPRAAYFDDRYNIPLYDGADEDSEGREELEEIDLERQFLEFCSVKICPAVIFDNLGKKKTKVRNTSKHLTNLTKKMIQISNNNKHREESLQRAFFRLLSAESTAPSIDLDPLSPISSSLQGIHRCSVVPLTLVVVVEGENLLLPPQERRPHRREEAT